MNIQMIRPSDQPTNTRRLLTELKNGLNSADYTEFFAVTAFAQSGPFKRLATELSAWTTAGKVSRIVIGLDQGGTSRDALELALRLFSEVYVTAGIGTAYRPIFHPKLYLFVGDAKARAFVGSNNFTVGGTETNFEVATIFDLARPADDAVVSEIKACFDDAVALSKKLTNAILASGIVSAAVLDEEALRPKRTVSAPLAALAASLNLPIPATKPPSVLPATAIPSIVPALSQARPMAAGATGLVIQIVPHHNGEIFLSKTAVDQNQAFFGFPFTGLTTPKKAGNPAYPQRVPDPIVDLYVYDAAGNTIVSKPGFALNTVYYDAKSEIRITVAPAVAQQIPGHSILVMRSPAANPGSDYDFDIYTPGSPDYNNYLALCNQAMPSGGAAQPRMFGWI